MERGSFIFKKKKVNTPMCWGGLPFTPWWEIAQGKGPGAKGPKSKEGSGEGQRGAKTQGEGRPAPRLPPPLPSASSSFPPSSPQLLPFLFLPRGPFCRLPAAQRPLPSLLHQRRRPKPPGWRELRLPRGCPSGLHLPTPARPVVGLGGHGRNPQNLAPALATPVVMTPGSWPGAGARRGSGHTQPLPGRSVARECQTGEQA